MRIEFVEVGPRVNHMAFLRIVKVEKRIEFLIPPAFVSVAPNDDGRVIDVPRQHFGQQTRPDLSIVGILPTGQLIYKKYAQRIAHIEKMIVGRIMTTYGVHVHLLDEFHIIDAYLLVGRTTSVGPERMTVDSFENNFHAIDIKAVFRTEIHGTESDTLVITVQYRTIIPAQTYRKHIKIGIFGIPCTHAVPTSRQRNDTVAGRCLRLQFPVEHLSGGQ